jgi:hypothetical protein
MDEKTKEANDFRQIDNIPPLFPTEEHNNQLQSSHPQIEYNKEFETSPSLVS